MISLPLDLLQWKILIIFLSFNNYSFSLFPSPSLHDQNFLYLSMLLYIVLHGYSIILTLENFLVQVKNLGFIGSTIETCCSGYNHPPKFCLSLVLEPPSQPF